MKSTAATTVIPKLDKVLSEFGVPDVVKSDNDLGFKHRKVTLKWAHANGEVERFVRTVKKVIKTAKVEHKNYKQELNKCLGTTALRRTALQELLRRQHCLAGQ